MLHPGPGCDVLFELRNLRAQYPLSAFHRGLDRSIQRRAKTAALGLQVDEGDCVGHDVSLAKHG